ncbi:hypothetical protein BRCON_0681 [Candidatus Sumerlaea chitinivorans]|uniref:Uncharacterized protein n=1 Tax=Sumerlaea chitinivorans TaxID=2250252 RepID=A0A2Z4Y3J4_SUMC1|nr:hypothetical protein BRCON_0681 [Candidatus Sumerlaea chitinivorans]
MTVQPFTSCSGRLLINSFDSFQLLGVRVPPKQVPQKRERESWCELGAPR